MFKKRLFAFICAILAVFVSVTWVGCGNEEKNLVNIEIFALNDVHGNVYDGSTTLSIAKTATYFKNKKTQNPNTVILSSGDMWQGSSESNNTKGKLITEWMNNAGFDAMTLGNHEFDWGVDYIKSNAALASFPFLALNVIDEKTSARADFCQPSVMIERSGVQIGIIGAIGDCYSDISSRYVKGLRFATGAELTSLVKTEATRLRSAGADVIIYSIHDGYNKSTYRYGREEITKLSQDKTKWYYDQSLSDGYVDVVFEGHTHKNTVYTDSYGVYHFQTGGSIGAISYANLYYDTKSKEIDVEGSLVWASSQHDLREDGFATNLFDKYADEIGDVYSTIGTNATTRYSETLCDVAAKLYLEAGEKEWGEYDIFLAGGHLKTRTPYDLARGNVNYSMIQSLFPFDNELVICSILGADLKRCFIETDNDAYHVAYGAYGEANLSSIIDSATYYVVVDTYTADYAPNNLTILEYFSQEIFCRDLIAEYVKSGGFAQ